MKDKNMASRVANAWNLSQKQVNNLEEVMKTMVKRRHGKLPSKLRSWERNLTEEGIEPNPGPSSLTTIHSLNINGKHKAWNFMKQFAAERKKVAILQEVNLNKEEQVLFANAWSAQGYSVFFPAECNKALVAIIVHNSVPTRYAGSKVNEWGQIVSVELGDHLLSGIYRHPRLDFGELFLEHYTTVSRYQSWWAIGDWNLTPCNQRIWSFLPENTQVHFVRNNDGSARNTRWESERCIDWCASACGLEPITLHLNETHWSDHLELEMQLELTHVDNPTPVGTQDCTRPLHAAYDTWHDQVVRLWEQEDHESFVPRDVHEIDDCWEKFNRKLEIILTRASQRQNKGHLRPKGTLPTFHSERPHRYRVQKAVSFRERKLRKLLGRLKEAKRQGVTRSCELACFVPSDLRLPFALTEAISLVEAELRGVELDHREEALRKWKHSMQSGGKQLYKWVARKHVSWSMKVALDMDDTSSSECHHVCSNRCYSSSITSRRTAMHLLG